MRNGIIGKALERLEETTGQSVVSSDRLDLLESAYEDYRVLNRQLEDIGWTVLDYLGGSPQEMNVQSRRRVVQRARYVWMNDPQAGAAVELMNDFCFGRGVPRPRCKDPKVQEVVDEAWDDPDNQEVLTSYEAQLALGTDLALQSNVFLLMFDDGDDGKVKLSMLRHDDVGDIIEDPDKRHRLMWYIVGNQQPREYDFNQHRWKTTTSVTQKPTYYKHWRNVDLADEEQDEGARENDPPTPDPADVGAGKVYHARINRFSEQKFGTPRFQRTLRWYGAYNQMVKDRLDVISAAAALIMKRKLKGTPSQLAKDATKALSRRGVLGAASSGPDGDLLNAQAPPRPASIIEENESVEHEAFNLDTRAANAQADAQMIRAPISAAERFSQAYFGDASNSNLATATSLELPILKAVEGRQEVFEGVFRWFIDRVIEKAIDDDRISPALEPGEKEDVEDSASTAERVEYAAHEEREAGRELVEVAQVRSADDPSDSVILLVSADAEGYHYRLLAAHEDKGADEDSTERDLGYEFSLPSPLRRMMTDLISSVQQIATTFDPNGTNVELSRALLTIALGEGLEVSDAPDLVEEIFPKGFESDFTKMQAQAQAQAAQPPPNGDTAFPTGADGNAYSAPMNATRPEDQRSGAYNAQETVVRGRDGSVVLWSRRYLEEHVDDLPEPVRKRVENRSEDAAAMFASDVMATTLDRLDHERLVPSGNGNGKE